MALLVGLSPDDELGRARLTEVRAAWNVPAASLAELRALLAPLAAELPRLADALNALRASQHEALHAPEWAPFVEALGPIAAERDAVAPVAARAAARVGHLIAARDAATEMAVRIANVPTVARGDVARAWSAAFAELLDRTGLNPAGDDPAAAAIILGEQIPSAQAEAAEAIARLAALDAHLQSLLG
jgi:hypothetical protein